MFFWGGRFSILFERITIHLRKTFSLLLKVLQSNGTAIHNHLLCTNFLVSDNKSQISLFQSIEYKTIVVSSNSHYIQVYPKE